MLWYCLFMFQCRSGFWVYGIQGTYKLVILYRKILIISPGLLFVQKAFLLGLFSEGLVIGRKFAFQNGLGLTIYV